MAHPGGRPLKFRTVEELQAKIDAYFDSCYEVDEETGKRSQVEPFTITGLALALDTSRETLMDIENENGSYTKEYSDATLRAKLRCQNYAEKQLFQAKSSNGAVFALKNYGWKDKQEIEHTGIDGGPIEVTNVARLSDADLITVVELLSKGAEEPIVLE